MKYLTILTMVFCLLLPAPASAKWGMANTEKVPVDRIVKNLQKKVKKSPDDASLQYQLGRAHALAWYIGGDTEVETTNGASVFFGFSDKTIQFDHFAPRGKEPGNKDLEELETATTHLEKALELDSNNKKARLTLGWVQWKRGMEDDAIKTFRQVYEDTVDQTKDLQGLGPGAYLLSYEAAEYLLELLDEDEDGKEIKRLRVHINDIDELPRAITPIVLPLEPGLTLDDATSLDKSVPFDLDGTGLHQWQWLAPEAAWLVHDPGAEGRITSGLQLFGNVTFWLFWDHGYDALAALDDNDDGWLKGDELVGLAAWQDLNSDGVSDPGEVKPLSELGVRGLAVESEEVDGIRMSESGMLMEDGSSRPTWDWVPQSVPES